MARPIKEGLAYFPMDVGFFEDSKIRILRARFGPEGVMVYLYYICSIYGDKGYYCKSTTILIIRLPWISG